MGFNTRKKNLNYLFIGIISILFLSFIWYAVVVPEMLNVPSDFSYSAEVASQDNFYNEEKGEFGEPFKSQTKFSYEVVSQFEDILTIKNIFDVRNISGEKIFSVERLYGIDKRTGKHVTGYGDKDRNGYLFAPRNLKKHQNFIYWHINYDTPAYMEFQDEINLYGLNLYQYETDYHADQTADLGHLPGVPEKRGVKLNINLKLWIEPITGRLIKYEDDTLANYYNLTTNEVINPWNKFNNRYVDDSVKRQILETQNEIFRIRLIKLIIPILFLTLLFFVFLYLFLTEGK